MPKNKDLQQLINLMLESNLEKIKTRADKEALYFSKRELTRLTREKTLLDFRKELNQEQDKTLDKELKAQEKRKKLIEDDLEAIRELDKTAEQRRAEESPLKYTRLQKEAKKEGAFITSWVAGLIAKSRNESIEEAKKEEEKLQNRLYGLWMRSDICENPFNIMNELPIDISKTVMLYC